MTTRVTIDAHAGWPVLVEITTGEPGQLQIRQEATVEPGTVRDFYIHSGCVITGVRELPHPPKSVE